MRATRIQRLVQIVTAPLMTLFLVALLLAAPHPGIAQANPRGSGTPSTKVIGSFFALSVADLEASTTWYQDKLGLKIVQRGGPRGRLGGFVVLEGGGFIVELIKHDDSARSTAPPETIQGIMKAGALVADFDGMVSWLRARGVEIVMGPYPPRETVRANLVFKDNAGNMVQLFGGFSRR